MPNDCFCEVRIGANKEQIALFDETEFSFEKLRPTSEGLDVCEQIWGTKWDRVNYKLKCKGNLGMVLTFESAWNPPFTLFEYLVEKYHDVWLKCEWSEEGGMAGIFIVYWDTESKKVIVKNMEWDDWCLEEWHHRMQTE